MAGLRLGATAGSAADLELVRRVVGNTPFDGSADAFLVVDDVGPAVPERPPDFRGPYGEHWDDGTTHWFRHHWGLTARVSPPHAWIGGPVSGHRRWVMVRNSMLFVLARLVLVRGRFLLHGAAAPPCSSSARAAPASPRWCTPRTRPDGSCAPTTW